MGHINCKVLCVYAAISKGSVKTTWMYRLINTLLIANGKRVFLCSDMNSIGVYVCALSRIF